MINRSVSKLITSSILCTNIALAGILQILYKDSKRWYIFIPIGLAFVMGFYKILDDYICDKAQKQRDRMYDIKIQEMRNEIMELRKENKEMRNEIMELRKENMELRKENKMDHKKLNDKIELVATKTDIGRIENKINPDYQTLFYKQTLDILLDK